MMPEGWEEQELGNLIDAIGDGGTPSTSNSKFFGGSIPWAVVQDVKGVITQTTNTLTEAGIDSSSAKLWPQNTIILTTGATIGEVGIAGVPLATKQGITGIVCNSRLYPKYLYFVFQHKKAYIQSLAQGSTFREVRAPLLKKIRILLPPLSEQQKISAILYSVDRCIELTVAIIKKMQGLKNALLQELLTKGLPPEVAAKYGIKKSGKFKDSPLGKIPEEWDVVDVGDIANVTKLAGFEFTNVIKYDDQGEIIALRALNIKNEKLDLSDVQRIHKSVSDMLPRSKVCKDDVLITYIGAYIGDILRIAESNRYHLAPNVARITSNNNVSPCFLEWALRSDYVQDQMKKLTAVTATPSLTMTQIRRLRIIKPSDPIEQEQVVRLISIAVACIRNRENNLSKLYQMKKALMQDLLSGKVRVKVDDVA